MSTQYEPHPGVAVVALCDVFRDRLQAAAARVRAKGEEVSAREDWREMLAEDELDAVLISTPEHLHAPIAVAAARAGLDVYVEKCLTRTFDELGSSRARSSSTAACCRWATRAAASSSPARPIRE